MFDSHDCDIWVGTGFWLCSGFCIDKMYECCHDSGLTHKPFLNYRNVVTYRAFVLNNQLCYDFNRYKGGCL